jgi:hypothetical protein
MSCRTCLVALVIVAAVGACSSSGSRVVGTKDGTVTVNGKGAKTQVAIDGDAGSKLVIDASRVPDGFPTDVPRPQGVKLSTAAHTTRGGQDYFQLDYTAKGSGAGVLGAYRKALTGKGYTVSTSSVGFQAEGSGHRVTVVAVGGPPTTIRVTVSPS